MAIIITDQYRLRQKNFLDDRQGLATSLQALRDWNTSVNPLPDGFEVCVDGVWYVYSSQNPISGETGRFKLRNLDNDTHLEELDKRVDDLEERTQIAPKFSDILTPEFWTTSDGILHAVPGVTVSVVGDPDDSLNGLWYLSSSNYQVPGFWIKLVSRGDIIREFQEKASSDTSVYSSARVDHDFPGKNKKETITGEWNLSGDTTLSGNTKISGNLEITGDTKIDPSSSTQILPGASIDFGQDGKKLEVDLLTGETTLNVDKIIASTSDIGDLKDKIEENLGRIGIGNLLKGTSFLGQFTSEVIEGDQPISEDTQVYGDPAEYWEGLDYSFIDSSDSITGKACKLLAGGYISQYPAGSLTPGQSYTISWKQKGKIILSFDGNTWEHTTESWEIAWERFDYLGETQSPVRFTAGTEGAEIAEIKLEWGIVPTSWFPSPEDTDPIASRIDEYEYLRDTLSEKDNLGGLPWTLKLESALQVSSGDSVVGGISGIHTSPDDILLWAGGTYKESKELLRSVQTRPRGHFVGRFPNSTTPKRAIITYGDYSIFNNLVAAGDFTGYFYDRITGEEIHSKGITGIIPYLDVDPDLPEVHYNYKPSQETMEFRTGLLISNSVAPGDPDQGAMVVSDYNSSTPIEDVPYTDISFAAGKLEEDGRFILKVYTGKPEGGSRFSKSAIYHIYLVFVNGILVSIEKEEPEPTFYWY